MTWLPWHRHGSGGPAGTKISRPAACRTLFREYETRRRGTACRALFWEYKMNQGKVMVTNQGVACYAPTENVILIELYGQPSWLPQNANINLFNWRFNNEQKK